METKHKIQGAINALRKGDYLSALSLPAYIQDKYKADISELSMDVFFPLCAYELNETDISEKDITALKHMMDNMPLGSQFKKNASTMHASFTLLLTYQKQCIQDGSCNESDVQAFIHDEWKAMREHKHIKTLSKSLSHDGMPLEEGQKLINMDKEECSDALANFYGNNKINIDNNLKLIFQLENQLDFIDDNVAAINLMLEKHLAALRSYKTSDTLDNRINALSTMLAMCNSPHRPPDFITKFNEQVSIIEKNKPSLSELGLIGWLKNWLFNLQSGSLKDTVCFVDYAQATPEINNSTTFFHHAELSIDDKEVDEVEEGEEMEDESSFFLKK